MVEKIIVNPEEIRGLGNIVSPHSIEDYELYNSTLEESTATIGGVETVVYDMEVMSSTITVALSASVSTATIGDTVVLTATVLDEETPVTGEDVTFKAGTSVLGTATTNSNGVATYNYVTDTAGILSLTAVSSNVISTPVSLTVNKITPTVVLTANSSTVCIDEGVTLTATVKNGNIGIPGITVNFKRNGFDAGSVTTDSNGVATLSLTLATGTHTLNCSTVATDNYNSANSSDVSVTVTLIPTTTSLSLSQSTIYVDGSSTASATLLVRSTPLSGAVIAFYDGTSIVGSSLTDSNGVATYTLSGLTAGSHSITAYYGGGQNRSQSTSTAQTLTVLDHSYSIAFSQASYAASGGSATLELTLTDNSVPVSGATVSVTGSDSSSYSCITNSSGIGSVTVTGVTANATFTASYSGASDTCTVTVGPSYLFYDDCSSDRSSEYVDASLQKASYTNYLPLTYDSTNQRYSIKATTNEGILYAKWIPTLTGLDNIRFSAEVMSSTLHSNNRLGIVIGDSTDYKEYWYQLTTRIEEQREVNNTETHISHQDIAGLSANTWYRMVFEVSGTSFTFKFLDMSDNVLYTNSGTIPSQVIPSSSTSKRYGLYYLNYYPTGTKYFRNIKAESL